MRARWNMSTITKWLLAIPVVLTGWIAVMAGVMYFSDAAPAAVALFPADGFLANVPDDTALLARGSFWLTVSSDSEHFGPALYEAGAWLVLPAGLTGCLPMPKATP